MTAAGSRDCRARWSGGHPAFVRSVTGSAPPRLTATGVGRTYLEPKRVQTARVAPRASSVSHGLISLWACGRGNFRAAPAHEVRQRALLQLQNFKSFGADLAVAPDRGRHVHDARLEAAPLLPDAVTSVVLVAEAACEAVTPPVDRVIEPPEAAVPGLAEVQEEAEAGDEEASEH